MRKSSKSITVSLSDPEKPLLDAQPSPVEEALEATQRELVAEKDARREERFIWFAVVVVLFDALVFAQMDNWTGPVIIGLIELLILLAVGRKWGMDLIWTLTEMIIGKWDGRVGK